jgi:hypothetical protein
MVAAPPPPPSAATAAARKAEYERQRQAYLDRKRQEMEARKAKVVSVQAGEEVHRGPASAAEADAVGLSADSVNKPSPNNSAIAPTKTAPAKAGKPAADDAAPVAAAEPAPAPAEGGGKGALDNDFLNGLMDDPLGKDK